MALRAAIASGNWSNPAIWNGGVLPGPGDVVASNNYTVTIDQNVNVDSITNTSISPISDVPTMTYYTTPSGIASASTEYDYQYVAWKGFDGNTGNYWLTSNGVLTGWLAYEFTSAKVIAVYNIAGSLNNGFPKNWTFEGWNGSSWVILDTVVGNTNTSTYTGTFVNTTPYIKYRINVTLNNGGTYVSIGELKMYAANSYTSTTTAGGGFILNSGVTAILTNTLAGIIAGPTNCVTYSAASGTSTINGIVRGSTTNLGFAGVLHSGAANLNINGDVQNGTLYSAGNNPGVRKSGTGTLSIVGNLYSIVDSNGNSPLYNTGTGTINITGNLYGHTLNGYTDAFTNSQVCIINITGNIYAGTNSAVGNSSGLRNSATASINVTGNVYSDRSNTGITTTAGSLNIIGTLSCNYLNSNLTVYPAVSSTSSSAINIFSGPFISSPYGTFPYQCVRMHLIPSVGTYFEFRDETTNGAVSPGAIAPATRMIAPAGVSDSPIPSNVRYGTTYANGSLVGTLRMPAASSVAYGVEVDNTVGSAVLTPQSVWDFAVANLTTMGSIGERLKKTSTVDSTGAQLSSFEF